jgi:hypothetical protein
MVLGMGFEGEVEIDIVAYPDIRQDYGQDLALPFLRILALSLTV